MGVMNLVVSLIVLDVVLAQSNLEESLLEYPIAKEDEKYLVLDTRSEMDPKQGETMRRSTLDKNFARFGRGRILQYSPAAPPFDYDAGDAYYAEYAATKQKRSPRMGGDDFVRFGRSPSKAEQKRIVDGDDGFVRFGRRTKRAANGGGGSNFMRFGRNDNFMRFGRNPETREELLRLLAERLAKNSRPKY